MFLNFSPFGRRRLLYRQDSELQSWKPSFEFSRYQVGHVQPFALPSYLRRKQGVLWGNYSGSDDPSSRGWEGSSWSMQYYLGDRSLKSVCLDIDFEQSYIERWANLCHHSARKIFIRVPTISVHEQPNELAWQFKRCCDWLAAMALILMLSPVLLAIALLVKLSSPGPIFFRQWRVGQRGQLFQIYKFRTMGINAAEQHQAVMGQQEGLNKQKNDPRITPLGHWLRKSSLDELPQLFNVLRGEMSLVGPRPWALYDAVQIQPKDRRRLRALPGITGLWQVSGRSQILEIDKVTQLDLTYLRTWSLWSDFKILCMTLPSVLLAKGAC